MSPPPDSTSKDPEQIIADLRRERDEALARELALAEVLQVINSSPGELTHVFETILDKAHTLCGAAHGIMVIREGEGFRLVAVNGVDRAFVDAMRQLGPPPMPPPAGGLTARLMQGEQIVHIADFQAEHFLQNAPLQFQRVVEISNIRTVLAVPLRKDRAVIGMITAFRQEVRPFTDKQVALLQNFAAQAVIAMENARLLTETREALEQQTATAEILRVISGSPTDLQPTLDTIAASATILSGAANGAVSRFDGSLIHFVAHYGWTTEEREAVERDFPCPPSPQSTTGRAILTREVVHIPDVTADSEYELRSVLQTGMRTGLSVPILQDGNAIGAITVTRREVAPFSKAQISLLKTFADQAVIAIENVRLFNETREALEQQTATAEVLQVINSSPGDLAPVFEAMLDKALRLCEANLGHVLTYDGERFAAAATRGNPQFDEWLRGIGAFLSEAGSTNERIVRGESIIEIRDLTDDPASKPENPIRRALIEIGGFRTSLSVALRREQSLLGVLHIHRQEVRRFSQKEIALLQNFAAQAVIAMENARLITETREALEQQTATAEVLGVINSSPGDLTPVFDAMLEKAMRLCNAACGIICTYDGTLFHPGAARGSANNVSVAANVDPENGLCHRVRTCWLPMAFVPRLVPGDIAGVELGMDSLAELSDAAAAQTALQNLPRLYRDWIDQQQARLSGLPDRRREVATALLAEARSVLARIEDGIALLSDARVLDAFRLMNRAVAAAARRRRPGEDPRWYPFQLAFILLNLRGLVAPEADDREIVDLLFFPTGGGKTEAYLGLAAFVMVWRRLSLPGTSGCGLAVLMRYTLRLLTLDQLGRAAAVVCALELARRADPGKLGNWPFEIGLWVGRGATPNRMGAIGDNDEHTARIQVMRYARDSSSFPPIPIDSCPWCGEKLKPDAFRLVPDSAHPTNLLLVCSNRRCEFSRAPGLPVLTVDEPIYRRLPAFLIATVDKFAAMPWVGSVGAFFGRVERADNDGFYGPADPGHGAPLPAPLPPPDLIIQDELHLISGPLGSIAGLYETALEALCCREIDGRRVRPKLIASTATVRRAQTQIQALFDRSPPPGPERSDSFFATADLAPERSRLYLGLAAPGRSPKVLFLKAATTLTAAAQRIWDDEGGVAAYGADKVNPADPYMTVISYFNALRELGSARRIVQDEVGLRATRYGSRQRIGDPVGRFADRTLRDPLELTSRIPTAEVSDTKARLNQTFDKKDAVDVALATNMISVGLDVTRLGLMLVSGQPKTVGECIQATSRVGRDPNRPGLVVALLNVHKPRDRSHYERFSYWHAAFYRAVEATSVTPFAPRALDRGLAAVVVAMARLAEGALTPNRRAANADQMRSQLNWIADAIGERVIGHKPDVPAAVASRVRACAVSLLDDWSSLAYDRNNDGTTFGYGREPGISKTLLHEVLERGLELGDERERRFRTPRSFRDVEPPVLLRKVAPNGAEIDEDRT